MIMTNDSFEASFVPEGLLIQEKKKGAVRMLLVLSGVAVLMIAISLILAIIAPASTIVQILAPILFWGGAIVALVSFIAILVKITQNSDPRIIFNTDSSTLFIRGKVIPFNEISDVYYQSQNMMGQTANFIFLTINGKRTTLFSLSVISKDVDGMKGLCTQIENKIK